MIRLGFILGLLSIHGCASQKDFNRFQIEELDRDTEIIDLLTRIADNQLVMAKKLTAKEAASLQDDRRFLKSGRSAALKTDAEFQAILDESQKHLERFMKIK